MLCGDDPVTSGAIEIAKECASTLHLLPGTCSFALFLAIEVLWVPAKSPRDRPRSCESWLRESAGKRLNYDCRERDISPDGSAPPICI